MKDRKKLNLSIIITFVILVLTTLTLSSNGQNVTTNTGDNQSAGKYGAELTGGNWVLTSTDFKSYNGTNLTKWSGEKNEIGGLYSWKDILDIIHTVYSGFKWEAPPQAMKPGSYLNLEAIYTNLDYSTTSNVKTGIKIYIDRVGANYLSANPEAVEILKVNKDGKQNLTEVKKGFFDAPKTLFDETNQCELVVDCFVGKDHFVTKYIYTYQP
jgi:hypothetical protein